MTSEPVSRLPDPKYSQFEAGTKALEARLRKGLEGATPGQWEHYHAPLRTEMTHINEVQCSEQRSPIVQWKGFDNSFRSKEKHKRNAAHIAACSPDNILALLDTIATLRQERDEAREDASAWKHIAAERGSMQAFERQNRQAAEAEASTLRARLDEAERVMKPFAEYLDTAAFDLDNKGEPLPDDQGMGWVYLTIGHFRAARALSAKIKDATDAR